MTDPIEDEISKKLSSERGISEKEINNLLKKAEPDVQKKIISMLDIMTESETVTTTSVSIPIGDKGLIFTKRMIFAKPNLENKVIPVNRSNK